MLSGCLVVLSFCCLHGAEKAHKHSHCANGFNRRLPANGRKSRVLIPRKKTQKKRSHHYRSLRFSILT